jgi:hypothetical protein
LWIGRWTEPKFVRRPQGPCSTTDQLTAQAFPKQPPTILTACREYYQPQQRCRGILVFGDVQPQNVRALHNQSCATTCSDSQENPNGCAVGGDSRQPSYFPTQQMAAKTQHPPGEQRQEGVASLFSLSLEPKLTRRGSMLRFMIERHYGQRQIAEGFFNEPRIGGNQG